MFLPDIKKNKPNSPVFTQSKSIPIQTPYKNLDLHLVLIMLKRQRTRPLRLIDRPHSTLFDLTSRPPHLSCLRISNFFGSLDPFLDRPHAHQLFKKNPPEKAIGSCKKLWKRVHTRRYRLNVNEDDLPYSTLTASTPHSLSFSLG